MPHVRSLSGLGLLLGALVLASCGGGGSGSSATSTAPKPDAAPTAAQFPKATPQNFLKLAHAIPSNGPVLAPAVEDLGVVQTAERHPRRCRLAPHRGQE